MVAPVSEKVSPTPMEESEPICAEVSRLSRELNTITGENRLFRSFLAKSPNPLCFADGKGNITFANKAFSTSFYPVSGRNKDIFSLFSEAWSTEFRQVLKKLTPEVPQGNTGPIPSDGKGIWRWELSASFSPSGDITGYQVLGLDCTDTETLGKLDAAIAEVFDHSPLCLAYAENLKVKRVTPALCRLIGYSREQFQDQHLPLPWIYEDSNEVDLLGLAEELQGREPFLRETRLRTAEGKVIDVFILIIPLRIDRDRIDHFFFIRDISRRKELEKQRLRTELLLRHSPVILYQRKDKNGAPLDYVSENASLFGYAPQQLTSPETIPGSLVHPEDLPKLLENNEKDRNTGKHSRENTYRLRRADGQYRWVNEKSRIMPPFDDSPHSIQVGILMDVTDQVAAEKALNDSHLKLQKEVNRLEKAWEQTIGLLAAVTEMRDPYTMGHQKRVAHLAGAIAVEMGLDEKVIQETVRAALIHDIGKIKIPTDFLCKPGKLSEQEFSIIKEHVRDGAELLGKIDLPWPIREIVLQHHERLDGSGYPRGLVGEEILLPARVIAVADVVEAMASHRPYRPARGIEPALVEISALSGILYDAEVVSACRSLFLEKNYHWPPDTSIPVQTDLEIRKRVSLPTEVLRGYRRA